MKIKIYRYIQLVFISHIIIICLYGCGGREKTLYERDVMIDSLCNMTLKDAIGFIGDNREAYDFLEPFFIDSIIPVLDEYPYPELREIKSSVLTVMPEARDAFSSVLESSKMAYKELINADLNAIEHYYGEFINSELREIISLQIDSVVQESISDIFEKYSGGFMNWKKVYFFSGRNSSYFAECWNDKFNDKQIEKKVGAVIDAFVLEMQSGLKSYAYDSGIRGFELHNTVDTVLYNIELNENLLKDISDYTEIETEELEYLAIRDLAIPIVLSVIPGAAAANVAKVYDIATLMIDVNDILEDIKLHKLSREEILIDRLVIDVEDRLNEDYINKCIENINKELKFSRKSVENIILLKLEVE